MTTEIKSEPENRSSITLANKITMLRIILIPVIVICLLERAYLWFYLLFAFTVLTDLLDGLAARIKGEQTMVGAFLDPMADKLLLTSVYLTLTYKGIIDVWIFVVVFSRDLLIVLGWGVIYILTRSPAIHPRLLGKITTAVQMGAAFLFTIPDLPHDVKKGMIWLIVTLTGLSVLDYVLIGEKKLGQWE